MTFDDHIRAALDRAAADARGGIEKSFTAFAQEVARAVAEERAQLAAQASRTTVEARAQVEEARRQTQDAHRQVEEARHQVEEMRRHAEEVARRGEAQLADLRAQAAAQLAQLREAAQRQVEELRRSAEAQVVELKKAIDEARASAAQQLDETRRTAHGELAEVKRLAEAEIEKARRAANAEAEDLVISQLAAAAVDNDKRTQEAVARVKQEADAEAVAQAARLASAIAALDQARSLGELLDYLAQCAGNEVDRAAVLLRKGERLQGWRLVGFGVTAPPAKSLDLDPQAAGLLGAVLAKRSSWSGKLGGQDDALPPFARGEDERDVFALPVLIGGEVVAVLYGDRRADGPDSRRWHALLEVLARHVSRALEAMTVRQATGLSLPRPMARASQPVASGQEPGHIQ